MAALGRMVLGWKRPGRRGIAAVKPARRTFLRLAAGAAALPAVSRLARAQTYPTRAVRIVASAPPGGNYDTLARLLAPRLSERFGQPFVVDNRPGGGTNIGTEVVVRAPGRLSTTNGWPNRSDSHGANRRARVS